MKTPPKGRGRPRIKNSLCSRARNAGMPYRCVWHRIHVLGWDEYKALRTPIAKRGRVGFVARQLAAESGIKVPSVREFKEPGA